MTDTKKNLKRTHIIVKSIHSLLRSESKISKLGHLIIDYLSASGSNHIILYAIVYHFSWKVVNYKFIINKNVNNKICSPTLGFYMSTSTAVRIASLRI